MVERASNNDTPRATPTPIVVLDEQPAFEAAPVAEQLAVAVADAVDTIVTADVPDRPGTTGGGKLTLYTALPVMSSIVAFPASQQARAWSLWPQQNS
jgi:hypothetical protein